MSSVLTIQTMIAFGLARQLGRNYVTTAPAIILPMPASIHYFCATGAATEAISEVDAPAWLGHKYMGTITQSPFLSGRPSSATGSVLQ
jgi:hypothetical protein